MKGNNTTRRSTPGRRPKGKTNWQRLEKLSDRELHKAVRADPDAAPLADAEWFRRAKVTLPLPKQPVSIRLDRDVMNWFQRQGRGYQTRINAVLRAYVESRS